MMRSGIGCWVTASINRGWGWRGQALGAGWRLRLCKGYGLRILIRKAKITAYKNLYLNNLTIFSLFTYAKIDALRIFTDFRPLSSLKIWLHSDLKIFSWKGYQLFLRFFRKSGRVFLENLLIFTGKFTVFQRNMTVFVEISSEFPAGTVKFSSKNWQISIIKL